MADVAPYGRDLVSGIIRAFTSADTLTDEDGTALISSGDTVNFIDLNISTSTTTIAGGAGGPTALPSSTITVTSKANRKLLVVFAQTLLEVRVLSGGDTTAKAEVEIGGTPIESSSDGRSPEHMEGGVSGAPASAGTHSAFAMISGGGAINPGNVTWGNLVKSGAVSGEVSSSNRVIAAFEVLSN